jgi:hypothetical protein
MPTLICNKRSTTLFEIIVATVIFALVMAGMVSVFVAGKRHVMHSRDRMTSSEMGKLFLDPLQLYVRQDTWGTAGNALNEGTTYCNTSGIQNPACPSVASQRKVNSIDYTAQYDVTKVDASREDSPRRVIATVNWTEN